MRQFVLKCHDSLGPVKLGMNMQQVHAVLGQPCHSAEPHERWGIAFPAKDYFFDNAFQVNYDSNGNVEFVEAAAHDSYVVTFDEIPVHTSQATAVLEAIRRHGAPDENDREYPCNQVFRDLDLTIYREHGENDLIDAIGVGQCGYTRRKG